MVTSSPLLDAHNVKVLGSGQQVVVLGHGLGTDQSVWKFTVPALLKDGFKVILYDTMGAGSTDSTHFDFDRYSSIQGFADDLLAILDELEVESCVYVGHSVSGMIGCLAVIERPELFHKLVLLAASPRYLNDRSYHGGFEQEDLDQLFASMKANFGAFVAGFAPAAVGADVGDRAVQEFRRTISSMRPDVVVSLFQTIFQSDLRNVLPEVTVPCYVVQSANDFAVPVEVAEYLNSNLGGWTSIEILQTQGHLPQLTSPELFTPVLLRCVD